MAALAAWTCIIWDLSARSEAGAGEISALYFWVKITSLGAGLAALGLIVMRIFKIIDKNRNFWYAFLGTTNLVLGLSGIFFYAFHKINIFGLHALLPNILIGITLFSDVFFFEKIFKKKNFQ